MKYAQLIKDLRAKNWDDQKSIREDNKFKSIIKLKK